jgi:hypothetical protein
MSETLDQARRRLEHQLGAGARFDSPVAPGPALRAMRLARAACLRQVMLLSDDALEIAPIAHRIAEIGCTARLVAETFERLAGHRGIEGDSAGRSAQLDGEIALARTLPGRALRALYQHALQHLDVACRDLDAAGWNAVIALPGATSPRAAIDTLAGLLRAGADAFGSLARHGVLPNPTLAPPSGVPS